MACQRAIIFLSFPFSCVPWASRFSLNPPEYLHVVGLLNRSIPFSQGQWWCSGGPCSNPGVDVMRGLTLMWVKFNVMWVPVLATTVFFPSRSRFLISSHTYMYILDGSGVSQVKDHCVGVPSLNRYLETGLLQTSFFAQSAGRDILLTRISRP